MLGILDDLWNWIKEMVEELVLSDTTSRRYFILADLAIITVKGMIKDGVITKGFDVINNYDYRQWLELHGASKVTSESAIVQAVYGLVFGGDHQYSFEAGTALRGLLRLGLTYKGHVYYRMMAGMGDVIFAPLYQVLQKEV